MPFIIPSVRPLRTIRPGRSLAAAVTLAIGFTGLAAPPVAIAQGTSKVFALKVSPGAAACLPTASGRITVKSLGPVESLHVEVFKLKPKTDYDLFVIQVPNPPFGLSWYQGDISTDANGNGVGDFVGRFSVETFIVAPGSAFGPQPVHPVDAIAGSKNPAIPKPIHTYHLGLWFNSPKDAEAIGCPLTITPFNGDHTAGIQVLNTGGFADDNGPLRGFRP
ncbi:MAG: hypothetical protein U1F76_22755 [Candidatus Competibacteraceae bacterium]